MSDDEYAVDPWERMRFQRTPIEPRADQIAYTIAALEVRMLERYLRLRQKVVGADDSEPQWEEALLLFEAESAPIIARHLPSLGKLTVLHPRDDARRAEEDPDDDEA